MPKRFAPAGALLVLASVAGGCSRAETDEPPVATPSVTLSRSNVAVGSPMDMTYRFTVAQGAPPFAEDYLVFVHFLDEDRERMWDDDHEPATPTRQWKPGATIEYARTIFAPKFPYVGPASVEIGLYSRTSGARLPLAGDDSGMRAYKVASFNMTLQSDNVFVIFKDGWHETEVADDGSHEWQWSRKEGTIAFRNPKRDAELLLEVDQPVSTPGGPQRVEVRAGGVVVDSFVVPPQQARQLRRIRLSPAQLGASENVEVAIGVDRTFVPSALSELRSSDPRELGIRVFRAYVQPTP
jgi:hypothetical protein